MVVFVQVFGLALYLMGYVRAFKGKTEFERVPLAWLFGVPLVLWGFFVSCTVIGMYNEMLEWAKAPDVRGLVIWDHLYYATMGLNGLLWIASGAIFIITSFIQNHSTNADSYSETAKK
ncbi:MAG: hypothetical protein WCC63_02790 [Candidatus Bathyarchaeia archaeon]